jgi:hypothetical protein
MVRRVSVYVVGLLLVAGCADRRTPEPSVRDSKPTPTAAFADTVGCELVAKPTHPDAEALVREFVRRDASGEFTAASSWFTSAVDCPGHEGSPDAATMARDPRVRLLARSADSLRAEIRWERLMVGEAIMPGTEMDTLVAIHTRFGWRIRSPALTPHVPVPLPPRRDAAAARAPAT